jgi:membrane-associated phospholipid phosphatase
MIVWRNAVDKPSDEFQLADRQAARHWWLGVAVALAATLALAPWDIAISEAAFIAHPTGPTGILLRFVERLGNGGGVAAILVALVILDRRAIGRLPQLVAASIGAGLLADCLKLCVARARPYSLDLATTTSTSTFHGWFPMFSTGAPDQSFPSAHAMTATGLAVALAFLYPRGRWLFALAAAAVMVQRVIVHAHFPTDVMTGAILGAIWARQCHRAVMGRGFAVLEDKIDDMIARQMPEPHAMPVSKSPMGRPNASAPPDEVSIPASSPRRRSA